MPRLRARHVRELTWLSEGCLLRLLLLFHRAVRPDDDGVVTLVRLEGELLGGLKLLLLQLLYLRREHCLRGGGGVDA